ncbi:MAG: hypothetical protein R3D25_22490 [Geminicoccaceae bacterium]
MWQLAQPLVEEWMIANLGPRPRLQQALADGLQTAGRLPDLVRRLDEALERDRTGMSWSIGQHLPGLVLAAPRQDPHRACRRLSYPTSFA